MSCLTRHLLIQHDILNAMESDKMTFPTITKRPPKPQKIYDLITMKCINCGAENSFKTRSVECEYCRTVLYRELPEIKTVDVSNMNINEATKTIKQYRLPKTKM